MKKFFFSVVVLISPFIMYAQTNEATTDTSWKGVYRATATKINDLVNTRLDVKFDYNKAYLYGKAWITLHPHFYPTDSLLLDAKGMDIKEVAIQKGNTKTPLKYSYDTLLLNITL